MSEKLSTLAYRAIKTDIIHCVFQPGEQLTQSQLVERYDFGIVPIREALQRLAQDDLVEVIPRTGYRVPPITLADVHEVYELRLLLEVTAARMCAQRAEEACLQQLLEQASFTYYFADQDSYAAFLEQNAAFHVAIAAGGGNQRLVRLISRLMDDLTRVLYLGLGERDRGEVLRGEHICLAEALLRRDPDETEAIVRRQVQNSLQTILESITSPQRSKRLTLSSARSRL